MALWEAVRAGLVIRSDGTYTFLHDRIQEAAYALIAEGERAMAHLRIGRLLAARTAPKELEEKIFDIVNQFDRSAALITADAEREQVAELNLLAGKRAKAATAYAAALQYFIAGRTLLAGEGWEQHYRLTFELELNWAECEYLTGELAAAEERLSLISTRARTTVHLAAVACVRINLYTTLDRSDSAVGVGLDYLRRIDAQWPLHVSAEDVRQEYDRLWQRLGSGSIEALFDLPVMADPDRCATMDVLTVLTSPALFTDENLFRLVVGRMATLSLEHGNSDGSCLAYAWLGGVLGTYFGDYWAGFRFGRLGLDLVEKDGLDRFSARVYLVFAVHVAHWTQHLRTCRAYLRRAFEAAQNAGDLSYGAYSRIDLITNLFATGDSLSEVEQEAENGLEFARKVRFGLASDCITGQLRLIRMLRGLTPDFTSFNDAQFDEGRFEQHLESDPQLAIGACWYWIRKLQAGVYAGDYASAITAVSKAAPLLWTAPTQFELAEYHFYGALARAAHCDMASVEERPQRLEALAAHHEHLAIWAKNCPSTFANRAALTGAEVARLEGRELDAMRLYEEAIRLARERRFIQNEGLAHELAARFYEARGFETIANAYVRNARSCYLRWGADGKVQQLEQLHPHLRKEEPAVAPTGTIGTPVEHLDLATVINVSQAVSGEIVLEKLLDTLMRTAIAQAGAERGLLILLRGAEPRIAADVTTGADTVLVQLRDEPVTATVLPESVLHYVLRTRESVILDDAAAQPSFAADPYIQQHHARSILGLPLLNQARLIGVLYLENNLAPRVFAPARIAVLKLLASQVAISLENTRLYRDLAEREAKIRRLVDANIVGIFLWDFNGRILEANDAFLHMLGYDREDLVAGRLSWTDLTPPDWHERDEQWVEEHKRTGLRRPIEKEFFRKDGSRLPILLGAATFDESENQGLAFVLDLTERKRAEYLTGQVFENSPDGIAIVGRDYRYQRVNPVYERRTGIPAEGFVGMHLSDANGTEAFEQTIKPSLDRCFAGEEVSYAEWFTNPLGRRYMAMTYTPLRPGSERVEAALVVTRDLTDHMQDITDRKRAEDAARLSEKELRAVIETVPAMVWTALPDGHVDFINRRWQEFTGLTLDETLGWSWEAEAPFHPDDFDAYMVKWQASLATGQPFEAEMRIRRAADGEYRWLFESAVPLRDEQGNILKWYGFVVDIEDRKRAEEALRKAQMELAHVARVTTLGELTASIAHEVNQPLAAIVTNGEVGLQWLDREVPDLAEVRETLGDMIRNGRRAGEIIQRLRALSGKTETQKVALDINDVIREVIPLVHQEVLRHRVSLRLELAPTLPAVLGDRVQLQQVIINLLVNGMEAMAPITDRPREMVVRSQLDGSGQVLVAVQDSGVGIDPENAKQLFNAFFTTKPSGMGMGLSICRSIIEAHGGTLWASRNAGPGATFQFTLPSHQEARS